MQVEPSQLMSLIDAELARLGDNRIEAQVRSLLVEPAEVLRAWDYGGPDEKFVTEQAYDNPRFVEDMVREVSVAFDKDDRIASYEIEVENHESIHAHNAYAYVKRDKS